jgi:hypothetical protein
MNAYFHFLYKGWLIAGETLGFKMYDEASLNMLRRLDFVI